MTRYKVAWSKDALDGLAEIWVEASDRRSVTSAVRFIDADLAHDPMLKGGEVHEGLRMLVASPLRVYFEVEVKDRLTSVVAVALLKG
jgi:plasmid stabilization system protein ParE